MNWKRLLEILNYKKTLIYSAILIVFGFVFSEVILERIIHFALKMEICGKIDFRVYLLCALYLIHQNLPTIELIQIASRMYDNCGKGPGRLTRTALHNILSRTMSLGVDECVELFTHVDTRREGSITIDQLREYFQRKLEYTHLFQIPTTAKKTARPPKSKNQ